MNDYCPICKNRLYIRKILYNHDIFQYYCNTCNYKETFVNYVSPSGVLCRLIKNERDRKKTIS